MAVPVEKEDAQSLTQLHYALPTTSSISSSYMNKIRQYREHQSLKTPETQPLPVQINSLPQEECPENYQITLSRAKYPQMVTEGERRRTFDNWPYEALQPVGGLVEAGFWYRGEQDRVTCYSCGKTMYNWEQTDEPWIQHALWSPHCDHVIKCKGQSYISRVLADQRARETENEVRENIAEVTNNVTPSILQPTPSPTSLVPSTISGLPLARQALTSPTHVASPPITTQLSIIPHKPRPQAHHPDFSDINARRATYRNWAYSEVQAEEGLAQAGFFYKGVGDQVTCYHCGYILHTWEEGDSPWEEHTRWSPQCPLVLDHQQEQSPAEGVTIRPQFPNNDAESLEVGNSTSHLGELTTRTEKKKQTKQKAAGKQEVLTKEQKPADTENKQNSSSTNDLSDILEENLTLKESKLCKVCMTEEINVVFLPCGHLVCCVECANKVSHCPICRKYIRGTVKAFWG